MGCTTRSPARNCAPARRSLRLRRRLRDRGSVPVFIPGMVPRTKWRSVPQIALAVSFTMASVGSSILDRATSSSLCPRCRGRRPLSCVCSFRGRARLVARERLVASERNVKPATADAGAFGRRTNTAANDERAGDAHVFASPRPSGTARPVGLPHRTRATGSHRDRRAPRRLRPAAADQRRNLCRREVACIRADTRARWRTHLYGSISDRRAARHPPSGAGSGTRLGRPVHLQRRRAATGRVVGRREKLALDARQDLPRAALHALRLLAGQPDQCRRPRADRLALRRAEEALVTIHRDILVWP